MKRWGLIVGSIILLLSSTGAYSYSADQVALEERYQSLIQNMLDNVYGKGNFVANVTVDVTNPQYSVKYTQESKAKTNEDNKKEETYNILPGYPAIKNLAPDDMKRLPFDSVTSYIPPQIKKITVDLVVNRNFPRGQVARAQALIGEQLNLDSKRDVVNVSYMPFYTDNVSPEKIEITQNPNELFTFRNLLILILLIVIFIFGVIFARILSGLGKVLAAAAPATSGGGGHSSPISLNPNVEFPEMPESSGGDGHPISSMGDSGIKHYFNFISERNISNLLTLMKKENMPLEKIAVLVSFLKPRLAAKVLSELDIKDKARVAMSLATHKQINKDMIEKFETQLKTHLECSAGGESQFETVFNYLEDTEKNQILDVLRRGNPDGYQKIRQLVLIFEDLANMSDEDIRRLLNEITIDKLSVAMVDLDPIVSSRFIDNLSIDGQEMVQQFLELKTSNTAKRAIQKARRDILKIGKQLATQKQITLHKI